MKPVRDTAALLAGGEGAKVADVLHQLLQMGSSDLMGDLPSVTAEAVISCGLDPAAPPAVRHLAYQVQPFAPFRHSPTCL
jgi:hypothetical protein